MKRRRVALVVVIRKGETVFARRPSLAGLEPIARRVAYSEWSPDGRTLAFVRYHYGDSVEFEDDSLHVVKADGTGLRTYGRWDGIDSVAWSPNAQRIAFSTLSGSGRGD